MSPDDKPVLSRRGFLRTGAGVALAGALGGAGLSSLAGCGSSTAGEVSSAADVTLPTTIPFKGPTPDIAGTAEGVPAAFYNYPKPVRAFTSPPLRGEKITAITNIFNPAPPGRGANPAWREVEKQLGATVDITMVSSDDYETKLNTVVAGGDLPDLMLYDGAGFTNLPAFLAAKCADLTPLLGGDAIKDYPHLADIPELIWKQCTDAGKLYMLPIPRNLTGGSGFIHQEMFEKVGVKSTEDIKSADDFLAVLKELTRPQDNQWAIGAGTKFSIKNSFLHIFRAPYQWQEKDGKLTSWYETDEFGAAIEFAAKVHRAGCMVPGSEGWTKAQLMDAYQSGKVAMIYDGFPSLTKYWQAMPKINKSFRPALFIPFGHDGGKGQIWYDNIAFATVMLKKASKDRLKTVLKACDFLAAPFGTEEYLLLNYGVEGVDYKLDARGNPVNTDKGMQDINVPWKYIAAPQQVIYDPTSKGYVDAAHAGLAKLIPLGVEDPCATLYSPTAGRKNEALSQGISDTLNSIIAGRKPMSAWAPAVKAWRAGGGDTIRKEYEQALAKQKKN